MDDRPRTFDDFGGFPDRNEAQLIWFAFLLLELGSDKFRFFRTEVQDRLQLTHEIPPLPRQDGESKAEGTALHSFFRGHGRQYAAVPGTPPMPCFFR